MHSVRVQIDGGWGWGGSTPPPPPISQFIPLWPAQPPNLLVPAVLLTLPVHFSQFEHCIPSRNAHLADRRLHTVQQLCCHIMQQMNRSSVYTIFRPGVPLCDSTHQKLNSSISIETNTQLILWTIIASDRFQTAAPLWTQFDTSVLFWMVLWIWVRTSHTPLGPASFSTDAEYDKSRDAWMNAACQTLVISRIDYQYNNSILAELPAVTLRPLTTVRH